MEISKSKVILTPTVNNSIGKCAAQFAFNRILLRCSALQRRCPLASQSAGKVLKSLFTFLSLFLYFFICISNSFFPPVAAVFKGHSITSWQRRTTFQGRPLQEQNISFFLHQCFRMQKESVLIYYFLFVCFFSLLMWNHWNLIPLAVTLCLTTELHCGDGVFAHFEAAETLIFYQRVQRWAAQIPDTAMHR